MELMIRTIKGIYTYKKDHAAKSMVFSPWNRTITPFPPYTGKYKPSKVKVADNSVDNNNAMLYISAPPKPKHNPRKHASGKTRTRWSNQRHRFNLIKTDRFHTHDSDSSDWNKLDMIQPTPKRLYNQSSKDCTYYANNSPHPPQLHQTV